ncbi:MAG: hypothetical protein STSR0008_00670 [Ignavibacterium sp.]
MAAFHFKYNSLHQVKEKQEKLIQKELSQIEKNIQNIQLEMDKTIQAKKALILNFKLKNSFPVNELKFKLFQENYYDEQIHQLKMKIEKEEKNKAEKLNQLVQKNKEIKIFDSLKEKYNQNFINEQNKIEQKETDELANQKFIRKKVED